MGTTIAQKGYNCVGDVKFKMNKVITYGIFSVWKPVHMSSSDAAGNIRKVLIGGDGFLPIDERVLSLYPEDFKRYKNRMWIKVGHGGKLDWYADGLLLIGVGRSCSNLGTYINHKDKEYEFTAKLGVATTTFDGAGDVTEEGPWEHITRERLEEVLQEFRGTINQVPPLYSAKKIRGQQMSDLAIAAMRISVPEPSPVQITIKSLRLLSFDPPFYSLAVSCSSGTYMRALARDIGKSLGTCSSCTSITRTAQGEFTQKMSLVEEDWTYDNILRELRKYHAFCSNKNALSKIYEE